MEDVNANYTITMTDDPKQYVFKYPPTQVPTLEVFKTGANRNPKENELDYEGFLSPIVLQSFAKYMHKNRFLADGSTRNSDNWQKGIPFESYMKSLLRHLEDVWLIHDGYPELARSGLEEALNGLIFNSMGYLFETLKEDIRLSRLDKEIMEHAD